ncbi:Ig-like domain-containing protein, partial [Longimicrobium sp.]|uniref:Ig-like domain-containing protein n=1 Tax=Longimicrobium sp. TaxID=2029185 RepID=UPI002E33B37E
MTRTGLSPLVLAAALLALAGCGDGVTVDPGPEYPARGAAVSGDLQRDTVTDELPAALVVRVTDQGGDPLPGQTVTWSVTAGGGTLFAATSQTNAAGEASNRWTLGTVAGDTQRVEARMVDPGSGAPVVLATFRATGLADVPAAVAARAPAARAGSAGQAVADSLEALVTDAHGNPVAGAPVVWTVPAGGGSVSPGTTTTGADGVARTQWTLGLDLGAQQTAEAAISPAVRATFTATAGLPVAATLAKVSGDAQNGTVGTAPAQPLTVELRTSLGQPIAGAQVTWTAAAFSGTVTPPVSVTGADGRASTTWTLFTRPGMQQVTARVQGAADAVFTATAAPGPAASVTVVPGTLALTALGDTARLAATALDEYGNGAVEPLQWISRDPAVATVDAAGLVT